MGARLLTGIEANQTQRVDTVKGKEPKWNDVVIYDEMFSCQLWKLGKIVELYKSADSKVRGGKIKVGMTGTLTDRPVNKLFPLEINSEHVSVLWEMTIILKRPNQNRRERGSINKRN